MTLEEKNAIEEAIIKGVESGLEAMIVNPFPSNGESSTQFFHAKSKIELAIKNALKKIRTT